MAHLKNLVVNGNSRTIGTVYASDYVGKVNGFVFDISTRNNTDTWVPVLGSNNNFQHREIPKDYNNAPSTLSVKHATSAQLIDGLQAGAKNTWGNQTGSNVVSWDTASGGSIQVRDNNPAAGQCSILVDGTVYVNEGRDAVISTADIGNQSVKYATSAGSANSVAWGNVSGKPATYAPSTHTHTIAQVTNLQSSLDGKATKSHTHAIGDISNLQSSLNNKADLSYLNNNFYSTTSVDNKINGLNYRQCALNGGNTANYSYHRFLSVQNLTNLYWDGVGIYLIDRRCDGGGYGIIKVAIRTNEKTSSYSVSIKWLARSSVFDPADVSYGAYLHDSKLDVDVFMKCRQWPRTHVYNMFGTTSWAMMDSNEVDNTTTTDRLKSVECYSSLADAGTKIHSAAYSRTGTGVDEGSVSHAVSAQYIDGMKAPTSSTWGNQTGTSIVNWATAGGGGVQFRDNNPSSGQVSMLIDGTVYVNEGKNAVISMADPTDLPSSYTGGNIFKNP